MTRKPKHLGRYLARKACGDRSNRPVEVVRGELEPCFVGEAAHYCTQAGEPIRYPRAYAKRGWSNMDYYPSTLRVRVGSRWLAQAARNWLGG